MARIPTLVLIALVLIGGAPLHYAHADEPETLPLLMIVVGFEGGEAVPYDTTYDWHESVFGEGDSLASYYRDMSGGAFAFVPATESCAYEKGTVANRHDRPNDGIVHVSLRQPHEAWGLVNEDPEMAKEFGRVVLDAVREASAYVDFESFDANGDSLVTTDEMALAICVAGFDASPFENPERDDIPVFWPHAGNLTETGNDDIATDGVAFESYIAIAEKLTYDPETLADAQPEPLGILYHELGHYLGLPDLYPLNDRPDEAAWGAYRTGPLSLMDAGVWTYVLDEGTPDGYRYAPTGLDAWSRYMLGWQMPQIAMEDGTYVLRSQLSEKGYESLLVPTSDPDQYFLVEVRLPEGQDTALANEYAEGNAQGGIVVWLVDKAMYRAHAAENEVNNTSHAPTVMEAFFESDGDFYSTNWKRSAPELQQPFYDGATVAHNLGSADPVRLPMHGGKRGGKPSSRVDSGVSLSFSGETAREMSVKVRFDGSLAATSNEAYPLDSAERRALRLGNSKLGAIACAALARETDADVALVDAASIGAGLPGKHIGLADAYKVLPADENIVCYEMSGAQLVELAEASLAVSDPYRRIVEALEWLAGFDIVDASTLPNADEVAPNADAALSMAGMSFDVDWHGVDGARISQAQVGGSPLDLRAQYYVATLPSVAARNEQLQGLAPQRLMLWGSPADALRSFIQVDGWEELI